MRKIWIRGLTAVLLTISGGASLPVSAQAIPTTLSGPFLRHRVTVGTLLTGCTVQLNGQTVARGAFVDFDNRTLSIQSRLSCAGTTGNQPWSHEWTGSVTVGTPADLPTIVSLGSAYSIVGAPMPTTASASFTLTPGASPATSYSASVEVHHGFLPSGSPLPSGALYAYCAYQKSARTNQPKTAFSMATSLACDEKGTYTAQITPPHNFGFPTNGRVGFYSTKVFLDMSAVVPGGSSFDFGRLELDIDTTYAVSQGVMTISPSPLRLSTIVGQTTPVSGTLEVRNSGGGLLDARVAASSSALNQTAGGTISGGPPYTISPSSLTDIGPGQSKTVTITVGPTERATGTYFNNQAFLSTVNATGTISVRIELVVGDRVDTISLTNVSPPAGSGLAQGSQITLTAAVNVVSAASGSVVAELRDPSGSLVGSVTSGSLPAGSSNVPLTLTVGAIPPTATKLTLKAILRTGVTNTESAPVDYTIGVTCPAKAPVPKEPRIGDPRDAGECDFIRLDLAVPSSEDPILATADFLPAFCGSGTYTYSGTRPTEVVLVLIRSGDVLATSAPQPVTLGVNRWGGDCFRAPFSVIRESEVPAFDIPAGTPFDRPVGGLRLEARLREAGGGPTLATSNPAFYTVIPGASFSPKLMVSFRDATQLVQLKEWGDGLAHSGTYFAGSLAGAFNRLPDESQAYLLGEITFAGQAATLDASFTTLDVAGDPLPNYLKLGGNLKVTRGTTQVRAWITGFIPVGTTLTRITPQLRLINGQVVSFAPLLVASDSLRILSVTPEPDRCAFNQSTQCLVREARITLR